MESDDLYQDRILDHYRHPRHYGPISDDRVLVDEENPMCGDRIRLSARVENGRIASVQFDGKGCAISMASSSMMTEKLTGLSVVDARALIADFLNAMREDGKLDPQKAGDLMAMEGVKRYPLRIKCATLGWQAVKKALDKLEA